MNSVFFKLAVIGIVLQVPAVQVTGSYFTSASKLGGSKVVSQAPPEMCRSANPHFTECKPGVSLALSEDGHSVSFTVTHVSAYSDISYELTYNADSVMKGMVGTVTGNTEDTVTKNGLVLGTYSSGVWTYDQNIRTILLKIKLGTEPGEKFTLTAHLK